LPKTSINTSIVIFDDYSNFPTYKLQIGDYTAKITYQTDNYIQKIPVEKYPFNFAVASDAQLQKAIQDNKANSGTTINIGPFNVSLFDFSVSLGSIFSIAVVVYVFNRRRGNRR
jgi:hypothetical protein